ncbi:hypothetical protein I5432_12205 [Citrobacter koseri]|uniref:hypothetical protein n=1 Tax=Citrobacter koseri TaxID=545 RepID=UPI001900F16C|nr:hypothetical protein [Citrobacter koseri]MBJ8986877.1 hypothetical protein [Citrobacter koseri]MBJ9011526.1 hypothetical protein [Citrobacter koseri]
MCKKKLKLLFFFAVIISDVNAANMECSYVGLPGGTSVTGRLVSSIQVSYNNEQICMWYTDGDNPSNVLPVNKISLNGTYSVNELEFDVASSAIINNKFCSNDFHTISPGGGGIAHSTNGPTMILENLPVNSLNLWVGNSSGSKGTRTVLAAGTTTVSSSWNIPESIELDDISPGETSNTVFLPAPEGNSGKLSLASSSLPVGVTFLFNNSPNLPDLIPPGSMTSISMNASEQSDTGEAVMRVTATLSCF